jgi:hypothetical protein
MKAIAAAVVALVRVTVLIAVTVASTAVIKIVSQPAQA